MKKLLYITTLCICSFFVVHAVHAETLKLTKRVTDNANIIPDDTEASLEAKLTDFENKTGNQFVVVTIPNLYETGTGDNTVEAVAYDIFNQNKLGQEGKNNGLLFLISTAERKTRFEVGYGLEPVFPDILAGRVLRDDASPLFKAGDFPGGINLAVDKAIEYINKGEVYEEGSESSAAVSEGWSTDLIFGILFVVVFVFRILFMFFARSKSVVAGGVIGAVVGLIGFLMTGIIYMFGFILIGILLDWIASTPLGKKLTTWSQPRVGGWGGGGWGSRGGGGFSGGGGSSGGGGASGGY